VNTKTNRGHCYACVCVCVCVCATNFNNICVCMCMFEWQTVETFSIQLRLRVHCASGRNFPGYIWVFTANWQTHSTYTLYSILILLFILAYME